MRQPAQNRIAKLWLYLVSTASMLVGVAALSVAVLIVARYLGKVNYGRLTTLTALTSVCSAWVQFGTAEMVRRRIALDAKQYSQIIGHCIIILFGFGSIATLLVSIALTFVVHFGDGQFAGFLTIWLFSICTLVLYPWMVLVEQIFLAHDMFSHANIVNAGFGVWRAAVAAVACIGFGVDNVNEWAAWNFAAYAIASVAAALAVARFGAPLFRLLKEELAIGTTFGISGFLSNLRSNVDILSLSANTSPETVAVYGLARRVVGIAIVTSASFDRLIYSRLVHASQQGLRKAVSTAVRFAGYALLITGATATALFILSPYIIPVLFGASYKDAAPLVRLLCGLIVLVALQNIAFDALNSANLHKIQVAISSACIIAGAALVAALARAFAITGAISGVYIMEISLTIALWAGLGGLAQPSYLTKLYVLLVRTRPASRS